ncbi:hypothetical protein H490_0112780 [Leucobacter sp. UCD-THU]|uniref:DUF3093 domain-containing protein n=1 Tax=Leucobacter muris TaxID=1935379 RepID=A0ABX5QFF8_9MICO|nr:MULTISPECIES: DUF3093 domain-containing protein [Leucobacter]EYT52515.1 hypothetical protein H490_0112780 [Leucobacter sp. UCD-THU]QAB17828.1 DUF3093 domain-containing protein [Leucobacter muris]
MTSRSAAETTARPYRERLLPGIGLYIALLLLVPAVALVLTPINSDMALPVGVVVYLIVAGAVTLMCPVVAVQNGRLAAGRAEIPVQQLGGIELLGSEGMRAAIGPGVDARSYLVVRGWIHRGVRIENIDPADPAPFWIITTRHPQKLAEAIEAAKA